MLYRPSSQGRPQINDLDIRLVPECSHCLLRFFYRDVIYRHAVESAKTIEPIIVQLKCYAAFLIYTLFDGTSGHTHDQT
jgi:hypothetical protein